MAKVVYIASVHKDRTTVYAGTVEELVKSVFGYTLECGWSWNHKINRNPKSVSALVTALDKSVEETQGGCYNRDYYYATTKEEAEANGFRISER